MKLKQRKKIYLFIAGVVILIGIQFFSSSIFLKTSFKEIQIHNEVNYLDNIRYLRDGKIEDVIIDDSSVNIHQLGIYQVIYHYKHETKTLKIKVVDTKEPIVKLKNLTIAKNQNIEAQAFVEKIQDDTPTTVSFLHEYDFSQVGDKIVHIVVEDLAHNRTIQKAKVQIVEDTTPPVLLVRSFFVNINEKVQFLDKAYAQDDYDPSPNITVNTDGFNSQKAGTYTIEYQAKDFTGNQTNKKITVTVKEKDEQEKIVYLTFDDGPSQNTPKVLDILKKYHCQATFFVTGMNPNYRQYILEAYRQGHTIGLHTYSHNYQKVYRSTDAYLKDLKEVGDMVKDIIGYRPIYIRFPGGSSNTVSRQYAKGIMNRLSQKVEKLGYRYYDWNGENGDGYSSLSKKEMVKRATSNRQNYIMILMHDANGKENTVQTLPTIIEYYQKRGYEFKSIDQTTPTFHQNINN